MEWTTILGHRFMSLVQTNGAFIDSIRPNDDNIIARLDAIQDKLENPSWLITVLPTVTSILVVLIAALLAWRQMKSNVESDSLINWNDELRKKVAGFLTSLNWSYYLTTSMLNRKQEFNLLKLEESLRNLLSFEFEVVVLLYKDNEEHSKLASLLSEALNRMKVYVNEENNKIDIESLNDRILLQSQKIMKANWRKAKKLFYIK